MLRGRLQRLMISGLVPVGIESFAWDQVFVEVFKLARPLHPDVARTQHIFEFGQRAQLVKSTIDTGIALLFLSDCPHAALEEEVDRWAAELARGGTPETARWHEERALETYNAVRGLNNGELAKRIATGGRLNLTLNKPASFEIMGRIWTCPLLSSFLYGARRKLK
jgi:hypothetical protein